MFRLLVFIKRWRNTGKRIDKHSQHTHTHTCKHTQSTHIRTPHTRTHTHGQTEKDLRRHKNNAISKEAVLSAVKPRPLEGNLEVVESRLGNCKDSGVSVVSLADVGRHTV